MPIKLSQLADFSIAECSGEFTITHISDVFLKIRELVNNPPINLMVDLSQLSDFDSSALQLLLWLKDRLSAECQLQFIVAENDIVMRVLNLYHLSEQLCSTHDSFSEEVL